MSIKPGSGTRKDKTWTNLIPVCQARINSFWHAAFYTQGLGLVHFSSTLYQKGVSWWCHWSPIRSLHIGGICHFSIWLWLHCNPVQNWDVIWTLEQFFCVGLGSILYLLRLDSFLQTYVSYKYVLGNISEWQKCSAPYIRNKHSPLT